MQCAFVNVHLHQHWLVRYLPFVWISEAYAWIILPVGCTILTVCCFYRYILDVSNFVRWEKNRNNYSNLVLRVVNSLHRINVDQWCEISRPFSIHNNHEYYITLLVARSLARVRWFYCVLKRLWGAVTSCAWSIYTRRSIRMHACLCGDIEIAFLDPPIYSEYHVARSDAFNWYIKVIIWSRGFWQIDK